MGACPDRQTQRERMKTKTQLNAIKCFTAREATADTPSMHQTKVKPKLLQKDCLHAPSGTAPTHIHRTGSI